jgi:4-hydroxyphenylacetate decarboxylase small subunit
MSKHNDCKNFTDLDVFKGYCRKIDALVLIDVPTCKNFAEKPKCRNCTHFSNPDEFEIGSCVGLSKEYWSYGEMNAKTCEGYSALNKAV